MSSSDEAPEEVSFNESKLAQRLQEKKTKQAEAAARHESKQKRRDRDQKLKQQQQGSTKKKLSEILQETASDDDQDGEGLGNGSAIESIQSITQPPVRQKKTFAVKDGYTVKVSDSRVSKKKKRLPPAGSDAINKREQFLFRESVPRK